MVNVVESPARLVAVAPIVIDPASCPVTVLVAIPLEAVALPNPVTVPVPAVLAKVTEVLLSVVTTFWFASRTSTVSARVAPDVRLVVADVKDRKSVAQGTRVD